MGSPSREELLRKIQELEASKAHLRDQLTTFTTSIGSHHHHSSNNHNSHRLRDSGRPESLSWKAEPSWGRKWTEKQYFELMESLGQATHILGLQGSIVYWNHTAEKLYGFTKEEAIGKGICELLVDDRDFLAAEIIIARVQSGERWTGQFPVVTKSGEMFPVMCTLAPFYDDDGTLVGAVCVGADARPFMEIKVPIMGTGLQIGEDARTGNEIEVPTLDIEGFQTGETSGKPTNSCRTRLGRKTEQSSASKLTDLASKLGNKVRSKLKPGDSNVISEGRSGSGDITPRGEPPYGVFLPSSAGKSPVESQKDASFESEGITVLNKLTSRAQAWIGSKAMHWTRRGNEHKSSEPESDRFGWPLVQVEEFSDNPYLDVEPAIYGPAVNEGSGSWSSFIVNSRSPSSSGSRSSSGSNSVGNRLEPETDSADYEIMWEDLTIGEQIGSGSCGTVYHGLWYGSDVAVKVFSKQEYSEEVVLSFKQEVSLMKRLRQPNILLFMGAVTSPQRLCIVTEFLPRGSLFKLLRKSTSKLDWRRRIHMAIDIARGMNYLHSCNPPIVHRDLKSSNLLVDKNWLVKVADFGLSRIKHETYLSTGTGKGTPQWMAPEVLRNERSNEKSDIYSFGVVLWELATQRIPWEGLHAMQVICAVGLLNQRLEIPKDVDIRWACIIESCWDSEPQKRPTFRELLEKLKDFQKQYDAESQASCKIGLGRTHKEEGRTPFYKVKGDSNSKSVDNE